MKSGAARHRGGHAGLRQDAGAAHGGAGVREDVSAVGRVHGVRRADGPGGDGGDLDGQRDESNGVGRPLQGRERDAEAEPLVKLLAEGLGGPPANFGGSEHVPVLAEARAAGSVR